MVKFSCVTNSPMILMDCLEIASRKSASTKPVLAQDQAKLANSCGISSVLIFNTAEAICSIKFLLRKPNEAKLQAVFVKFLSADADGSHHLLLEMKNYGDRLVQQNLKCPRFQFQPPTLRVTLTFQPWVSHQTFPNTAVIFWHTFCNFGLAWWASEIQNSSSCWCTFARWHHRVDDQWTTVEQKPKHCLPTWHIKSSMKLMWWIPKNSFNLVSIHWMVLVCKVCMLRDVDCLKKTTAQKFSIPRNSWAAKLSRDPNDALAMDLTKGVGWMRTVAKAQTKLERDCASHWLIFPLGTNKRALTCIDASNIHT